MLAKLPFKHAVDALDALLHRQLLTELACSSGNILPMDAWSIRTPDNGAFCAIASVTFQKKLLRCTAASFAF
jgi:hypothetical protein